MQQHSKYSNINTEIISESVPVYEKSSIDEFYIDLTGMDKFYGCYKWATELRHKIQHETGLPISFGLSKNKTVSKVATGEAKPNGQMQIDIGTEKSFLSPRSPGLFLLADRRGACDSGLFEPRKAGWNFGPALSDQSQRVRCGARKNGLELHQPDLRTVCGDSGAGHGLCDWRSSPFGVFRNDGRVDQCGVSRAKHWDVNFGLFI